MCPAIDQATDHTHHDVKSCNFITRALPLGQAADQVRKYGTLLGRKRYKIYEKEKKFW